MGSTQMNTPILQLRGISKLYGKMEALKSIDLQLYAGETIAVIGRSGTGKSTLLKCIALFEIPEKGKLYLEEQCYFDGGKAIYHPWEIRRNIGTVFQDYILFPNMTCIENIILALRSNHGLTRARAEAIAKTVSIELGISDCLSKYPNELSGGQAQRCALARAIVLRPKVLLLDEITSALDPKSVEDVVMAISKLRESPGGKDLAIILVTHLMQFAKSFAQRVLYMHEGSVEEIGVSNDFFENPRSKAARDFLNHPGRD